MQKTILIGLFTLTLSTLGANDVHKACLDKPSVIYRIIRQEGWYKKGSLVQRLKNPGALVYVGQRGARRHRSGFAEFSTIEAGMNALINDVESKLRRGKDLRIAWNYL